MLIGSQLHGPSMAGVTGKRFLVFLVLFVFLALLSIPKPKPTVPSPHGTPSAHLCYAFPDLMKKTTAILFLAAMLLTGCGEPEVVLPQGPQVVRGILQPVPVSLKRRGTHALLGLDGKMLSYAESTAVNLHVLVGREVELEGTLEKNTDPKEMPVFVVTSVRSGGGEQTRPWVIPALGLTVEVPKSWKASIQKKTATFTASGAALPVLTITEIAAPLPSSPSPPYGPASVSSVAGEALTVGLRKARAEQQGNEWIVRVTGPGADTQFRFVLQQDLATDLQLSLYRAILQKVTFSYGVPAASQSSAMSRPPAQTPGAPPASAGGSSRAAGDGAPCGGAAGILCPSGFYCRITDRTAQSGICVKR